MTYTAPQPTPLQLFQNSVNNITQQQGIMLNPANSQGIIAAYNRWFLTIFSNPNGTAAQAVANLSTDAVNVFGFMAAINTLLTTMGADNVPSLPAYTVNNDGTVTLSS